MWHAAKVAVERRRSDMPTDFQIQSCRREELSSMRPFSGKQTFEMEGPFFWTKTHLHSTLRGENGKTDHHSHRNAQNLDAGDPHRLPLLFSCGTLG